MKQFRVCETEQSLRKQRSAYVSMCGQEKKNATVEQLMERFRQATGRQLDNDRMLLAN